MGLDITAIEQAEYLGPTEDYQQDAIHAPANEHFAERADGLKEGSYTTQGKSLRFRAGSYSGYNSWRQLLCHVFHGEEPSVIWAKPEDYARKPFVELINFSDCEGTIGPTTSAKLAADFKANRDRFVKYVADREYGEHDIEIYDKFSEAFELASNNGLVIFH